MKTDDKRMARGQGSRIMEILSSDEANACLVRWEIDQADVSYSRLSYSPVFRYCDLSWRVCVDQNWSKHLSIFLKSVESDWGFGSVDGHFEISLINNGNASDTHICKGKYHFTKEKRVGGVVHFLDWKTVSDEQKGFISNNKLTIQIRFQLSNMTELRKIKRVEFLDSTEPRHDVAFIINGTKIYASKSLLALNSPVFNAMFFGEFKEKYEREVELKDVDPEAFLEMLAVLYPLNPKKIADEHLNVLLELADFYEIENILQPAEQFIIDSGIWSTAAKIVVSEKFRLKKLKAACLELIGSMSQADIQWIEQNDEEYANISEQTRMEITEIKKKKDEKGGIAKSL